METLRWQLLSQTALVSVAGKFSVFLIYSILPANIIMSSSAYADGTCGTYTNDVINPAYTCTPFAVDETNFSVNGSLIGQSTGGNGMTAKNMYSTAPTITVGSASNRKTYVSGYVAITTGGYDSSNLTRNNTISLNDVSLYLDGAFAGSSSYAGIQAAYGGKVWINNFTLDIANVDNGDINGIIAGVPYGDQTPNGATLENYIHIANDYKFKAVKADADNDSPVTGIRAIQNNDGGGIFNQRPGTSSKATIVVDGVYSADITAYYGAGVYVSGRRVTDKPMPEVFLNDADITLHGRGNAFKVGKKNRGVWAGNDGWGAGKLSFTEGAIVKVDMADALGEAIAVTYGGSVFDASLAKEVRVNAQGNALRIGNDILTNSIQASADLIDVKINNAYFRTTTTTENLISVDQQQENVALAFTGSDTDLKAAAEGWLINVEGDGNSASLVNLSMDGDGAFFTGLTNKTTDATLNLNLNNAVIWNLQEKGGTSASTTSTFSQLDLSSASQVNAFGDFTLIGHINSTAGILNLSDGVAGHTLTLTGDYVGSENAALVVDTFLAGSGSPSDRIVNDGGSISGQTIVRVNNTDSSDSGAATDPGHGIKLVRSINEGTTTDDAFVLDANATNAYEFEGRTVIGAGAYAYGLYKGANPLSTSTADDYGENNLDNDWYLRSQLSEEEPEEPLFTVGVPLYEAYPHFLLGMNTLLTLQQRVGNRYWNNAGNKVISQGADVVEVYAPVDEAGVLIEENGIWGRIEGSHTKIKSRVSTSGTDYDYNTFKLQAGFDGMLSENQNGKFIGGVTVHYAYGKANISSVHGDGDIKTNGYGFGGTLTWYGENGFYVDNQAHLTWYDSDLNSDTAERSLVRGNNGFGYALSVETGKRITIDENWSVTPQIQLIYSNVRFDSFTDQFNGHVSNKRADSLQGRFGISADYQKSWLNNQGMVNRSYVYGIANLYNEFLNGTKVDVSGVRFTNKQETLWAGIGLGGSYNWNDDKYSIYGEGSINTSLKNFGDSYNYKGIVGLRVKW